MLVKRSILYFFFPGRWFQEDVAWWGETALAGQQNKPQRKQLCRLWLLLSSSSLWRLTIKLYDLLINVNIITTLMLIVKIIIIAKCQIKQNFTILFYKKQCYLQRCDLKKFCFNCFWRSRQKANPFSSHFLLVFPLAPIVQQCDEFH